MTETKRDSIIIVPSEESLELQINCTSHTSSECIVLLANTTDHVVAVETSIIQCKYVTISPRQIRLNGYSTCNLQITTKDDTIKDLCDILCEFSNNSIKQELNDDDFERNLFKNDTMNPICISDMSMSHTCRYIGGHIEINVYQITSNTCRHFDFGSSMLTLPISQSTDANNSSSIGKERDMEGLTEASFDMTDNYKNKTNGQQMLLLSHIYSIHFNGNGSDIQCTSPSPRPRPRPSSNPDVNISLSKSLSNYNPDYIVLCSIEYLQYVTWYLNKNHRNLVDFENYNEKRSSSIKIDKKNGKRRNGAVVRSNSGSNSSRKSINKPEKGTTRRHIVASHSSHYELDERIRKTETHQHDYDSQKGYLEIEKLKYERSSSHESFGNMVHDMGSEMQRCASEIISYPASNAEGEGEKCANPDPNQHISLSAIRTAMHTIPHLNSDLLPQELGLGLRLYEKQLEFVLGLQLPAMDSPTSVCLTVLLSYLLRFKMTAKSLTEVLLRGDNALEPDRNPDPSFPPLTVTKYLRFIIELKTPDYKDMNLKDKENKLPNGRPSPSPSPRPRPTMSPKRNPNRRENPNSNLKMNNNLLLSTRTYLGLELATLPASEINDLVCERRGVRICIKSDSNSNGNSNSSERAEIMDKQGNNCNVFLSSLLKSEYEQEVRSYEKGYNIYRMRSYTRLFSKLRVLSSSNKIIVEARAVLARKKRGLYKLKSFNQEAKVFRLSKRILCSHYILKWKHYIRNTPRIPQYGMSCLVL
jgi:hypothetical protein